jgi:hypothetical protein
MTNRSRTAFRPGQEAGTALNLYVLVIGRHDVTMTSTTTPAPR